METIDFFSSFNYGESLIISFTEDEIKNEPMFFNCDLDFAYKHGGEITKCFIDKVKDFDIIDTRVHMLMPGWYPCIPGWHHDDVPRTLHNGQPNYMQPKQVSHAMMTVNGIICPTVFAINDLYVVPYDRNNVYRRMHEYLELVKVPSIEVPDNTIIYFDDRTLHRGNQAKANGWRWFGRVSKNSNRKPTNEIRKQVQVYLDKPNEGW